MRNYKIPNEVESELKFSKSIYLFDFFIIVGLIAFRSISLQFVNSHFHLLYTIFLIIVGLLMIIRTKTNPQKRMYQALYFNFIAKKGVYIAIVDEKEVD